MARPAVRISSPDPAGLAALVTEQGWGPITRFDTPNTAVIFDVECPQVGEVAYARGLTLHELSPAGHQSRVAVPAAHRPIPTPANPSPAGAGVTQ